jgi:hypothetical protein
MSESALGFTVAVTRQNAWRSGSGFPVGGTKVPAGTTSALVMVVCGKERVARLSQLSAKQGTAMSASPVAVRTARPRFVRLKDKRKVY